jgi:uncharacterized membrane protein YeaQ/YmgE (transglycosylase-associated protein family)
MRRDQLSGVILDRHGPVWLYDLARRGSEKETTLPAFELDIIGWLIIGFLAGALSGLVVRNRTAGGCLANILIGVLGGLVGGFLAQQLFGTNQIYGWIGALVVAFVGAVIVRWLLGLAEPRDRRR